MKASKATREVTRAQPDWSFSKVQQFVRKNYGLVASKLDFKAQQKLNKMHKAPHPSEQLLPKKIKKIVEIIETIYLPGMTKKALITILSESTGYDSKILKQLHGPTIDRRFSPLNAGFEEGQEKGYKYPVIEEEDVDDVEIKASKIYEAWNVQNNQPRLGL